MNVRKTQEMEGFKLHWFLLGHWCEDGKKLEGWKMKHQVIKL